MYKKNKNKKTKGFYGLQKHHQSGLLDHNYVYFVSCLLVQEMKINGHLTRDKQQEGKIGHVDQSQNPV